MLIYTFIFSEAPPVNVAAAVDPAAPKPEDKSGHAMRALFSEVSKQIATQLGDRSAMFGPKDMITALQMKYLTPEGQNVVNSVLRFIPLFNEE